ncbi:MAG TPA: ABC transporter permease, partial [Thermodesulfobacteriota bacterium]|nr:ABC transporter permease [Thermodesulfobacteriota bacterium]
MSDSAGNGNTARYWFTKTPEGVLTLHFGGAWRASSTIPSAEDVSAELDATAPAVLNFDSAQLTGWDSSILTFLMAVHSLAAKHAVAIQKEGLPEGVTRLLDLAAAVPERKGARRTATQKSFFHRIGDHAVNFSHSAAGVLGFMGDVTVALGRLARGRATFRGSDFVASLLQCGSQALPIVSLISLLVGLILAFVGAVQLRIFGAQIFVASLVGIAMLRVMGAVMTGVIMAGRTGARFAAELGTMQVNEEIDALVTLGVSPVEFLVLPRMLALTIMMPLLCLYADLMGILGGLIVGVAMLDLNVVAYYNQTAESVSLVNVWIGLVHSFVFGILVS